MTARPSAEDIARLRVALALIGAASGLFFWLLFDWLPELLSDQRVLVLIGAFAAALSNALLLLVGRMPPGRAFFRAAPLALVSALVFFWASFRFDRVETYLETVQPFFAWFFLISLPLPFILAQETAKGGWRDYEALFDHAWSIFVRWLTAWAFTGLFWLVLLLSHALLRLVGFELIGTLVDNLWVSMPLTGAVLGLALAVLNELSGVVSTLRRLALQLLRLLLPLVAAVVGLFIVLVPFRGLDEVFGTLSAAATMLAMALGAVTLITSAVDARDRDAVRSRPMVVAARGLSVLLPLVVAIAVFAIWERVDQYGWTPSRLAAGVIALLMLVYALAYALSVLNGDRWRARIRRANRDLALAVIALSLLWLTPVLNAERISANSHLDRFLSGRISVEDLDVWALGQDWGRAGKAALEQVRALEDHPRQAALARKLARLDEGANRYAPLDEEAGTGSPEETRERLSDSLPLRPAEAALPPGALSAIPEVTLSAILAGCARRLPDGRPGCVGVTGAFLQGDAGPGMLLFWRDGGPGDRLGTGSLTRDAADGDYLFVPDLRSFGGDPAAGPAAALIARILESDGRLVPSRERGFPLGPLQLLPSR